MYRKGKGEPKEASSESSEKANMKEGGGGGGGRVLGLAAFSSSSDLLGKVNNTTNNQQRNSPTTTTTWNIYTTRKPFSRKVQMFDSMEASASPGTGTHNKELLFLAVGFLAGYALKETVQHLGAKLAKLFKKNKAN